MKSESEVRGRLKTLVSEEFDRRVAEASERLPRRCTHNYQHSLDSRRNVDGEPNPEYNRITVGDGSSTPKKIGLCLLGSADPEEWSGTICEEPIDAKKCPYFNPIQKGKGEIIREMHEDLNNPEWLKINIPEAHILLWILGELTLSIPWWKKVLLWFKVIRIEPVVPPIDPSKLLAP